MRLVIHIKVLILAILFSKNKKKLLTAFYPQINGQIKRQNSTMEGYLRAFVHWEQDNWAKFLLITKFAYNNIKNASTNHTIFKLNCGYHPKITFEKNIDLRSRSYFANKLAKKLKELIEVYCHNLLHAQKL